MVLRGWRHLTLLRPGTTSYPNLDVGRLPPTLRFSLPEKESEACGGSAADTLRFLFELQIDVGLGYVLG